MSTVELVFDGDFRVGIRTAIHFGAVGEEERAIGLRMCRSQHHQRMDILEHLGLLNAHQQTHRL